MNNSYPDLTEFTFDELVKEEMFNGVQDAAPPEFFSLESFAPEVVAPEPAPLTAECAAGAAMIEQLVRSTYESVQDLRRTVSDNPQPWTGYLQSLQRQLTALIELYARVEQRLNGMKQRNVERMLAMEDRLKEYIESLGSSSSADSQSSDDSQYFTDPTTSTIPATPLPPVVSRSTNQPMIQELLGQIEDLKNDIGFRQKTDLKRENHELKRENQELRSQNQDLKAEARQSQEEMCALREALKSIRSVVFTTGLKISANARDRKRKSSGVTEIVSEPQEEEEAQEEAEQTQVPRSFI
ncbi:unnamed protein product [Clonostachys chloroleuca]|uniref:Uncharacterized protein n=1 Tax=Clonostachys chloroleuca TaxID=1926264 RepID=A0AA35M8N4_9HYPO|nr:unnamed protein product [Clonostachys chloroleuca]